MPKATSACLKGKVSRDGNEGNELYKHMDRSQYLRFLTQAYASGTTGTIVLADLDKVPHTVQQALKQTGAIASSISSEY
jgi:hypothetical protein